MYCQSAHLALDETFPASMLLLSEKRSRSQTISLGLTDWCGNFDELWSKLCQHYVDSFLRYARAGGEGVIRLERRILPLLLPCKNC